MLKCIPKTQGGKGNEGMFIERDPYGIVAAGKTSAQPNIHVAEHLKHYLLQEEVDAFINDALIPEPKTAPYIRTLGTDAGELIYPPMETKFETLVNEMKETNFSSCWKQPLGKSRDQTPFLPAGFDIRNETFGRKTVASESAYSLIYPKDTPIGISPPSQDPGYQLDRQYCRPQYDPNQIFGIVCNPDKTGIYARCCLTDDRIELGKAFYSPRYSLEVDIKAEKVGQLGQAITPNDIIKRVPIGFAFGKPNRSSDDNVRNCLRSWKINSRREFIFNCLRHLTKLRRSLSTIYDEKFFRQFYLHMKYFDKANTGWQPKEVIYNYCTTKNIRVNPSLIEPLLEMWDGFDGSQIQYRIFIDTINYRKHLHDFPKIPDMADDCVEFSTTYNEMMRSGQEIDKRHSAGFPSGRYFDKDEVSIPAGFCKADLLSLPEESDVRTCVNPSDFTTLGISHRDLYARRSQDVVRRVFEATGEKFTDQKFNELWDEAKKYHSQGWVCFASFRKALDK